jgi:dipeptidyl aminopeptidase/acylaminoacyl peptidase
MGSRLVVALVVIAVVGAVSTSPVGSVATAPGSPRNAESVTAKGAFVFETAASLVAANGDGSGLRCLVREAQSAVWPPQNAVWSPDGSAIAFEGASPDAADALMTLTIGDGAVRTVEKNAYEASWSPDGKRLAYLARHGPEGGLDVVVTNADGTGRSVLAQPTHGHEPSSAVWSPVRPEIAFTDLEPARPTAQDPTRDKMDSIFLMRPDGTGRHRIVKDIGSFDPVWAPNGTMIAFTRPYGDISNLVERVWVVRADGRDPRPVGPLLDEFDMTEPAWSSVSRFLAVEGTPVTKRGAAISQKPHVYRLQPRRFAPRLLAVARPNDANWLAWAPRAAVVATATGNSIALVDAHGGRLRTIVARGANVTWDPLRRDTTAYNGSVDPALRCS